MYKNLVLEGEGEGHKVSLVQLEVLLEVLEEVLLEVLGEVSIEELVEHEEHLRPGTASPRSRLNICAKIWCICLFVLLL